MGGISIYLDAFSNTCYPHSGTRLLFPQVCSVKTSEVDYAMQMITQRPRPLHLQPLS